MKWYKLITFVPDPTEAYLSVVDRNAKRSILKTFFRLESLCSVLNTLCATSRSVTQKTFTPNRPR